MIKVYFLFICSLLIIPSSVSASSWYVDNQASGSNTGTSWANAWTSFYNINWGAVMPGDTVYISGGATSKTYNEKLIIGASGNAANSITVKVGQDAGHNGTVIISGEGIFIASRQYITISGQVGTDTSVGGGTSRKMRITGNGWDGIGITGSSNAIKILYVEIDNNGDESLEDGIGASVSVGPVGWEIAYCYVHDNYQDALYLSATASSAVDSYGQNSIHHNILANVHDDIIETTFKSVDAYENEIGPFVCPSRGHPDALTFENGYWRVYNNYFHGLQQPCAENSITAGIWPSSGSIYQDNNVGHWLIYNNVMIEPSPTVGNMDNAAIQVSVSKIYDAVTLTDVYILNNIVIGYKNSIWFYLYDPSITITNVYIENNVVYKEGNPATIAAAGGGDYTLCSHGDTRGNCVFFDYNDYYNTNNSPGYHSITSNPLLGSNGKPLAGSPVVDAGYNWQSIFTADKDGVTRPQGSAWDIGAYEYTEALQTCSQLSGTCCPSGQTCSGSFHSSSDCGSLCCVGTCETASQYFLPEVLVEAESGTLSAPIQTGSNSSASGGQYIYTPTSYQGSANFTFQIANAGKYRMEARILTPLPDMAGADSLYLGLDGEPAQGNDTYTYDTLQTSVFSWDNVSLRGPLGNFSWSQYDPMLWDLAQGTHTFTFYGREPNTRLDQIILRKACIHKSDNNPCNGCVDSIELSAFIALWYLDSSNPTLKELIEAIGLWKAGTGC